MSEYSESQSRIAQVDFEPDVTLKEETATNSEQQESVAKHWEFVVPWFLTGVSTLVLCAIGWFLYENLIWLRQETLTHYDNNNLAYRSYTYFMYVSSIRRSAGLFSGIALMFLGIGVSFYTIKSQTNLKISAQKLTFGLVTASPGILAMMLGVFLIAHNTSSKDKIPIYSQEQKKEQKLPEKMPASLELQKEVHYD